VAHDWPGNVRQLENALHRAVILCSDKVLRTAHLEGVVDSKATAELPRTAEELKLLKKTLREKSVEDLEKSVEDLERQFVLEALKRNDWNVTRSAQEVAMLRANFQALMRKHGVRIRGTAGAGEDPGGEDGPPAEDP